MMMSESFLYILDMYCGPTDEGDINNSIEGMGGALGVETES